MSAKISKKNILIIAFVALCVICVGVFVFLRNTPGASLVPVEENNGSVYEVDETDGNEVEPYTPIDAPPDEIPDDIPLVFNAPEAPAPTHAGYSWVIAPVFDRVGQFSNGLAAVMLDGKYGVIDAYGQVVVPIVYELLGHGLAREISLDVDMSSGLVEAQLGGKTGVIDTTGRVVIPFEFDAVFIRHEYGLAILRRGPWNEDCLGLIELATGREIVPFGADERIVGFGSISDGIISVALRDEGQYEWSWGYIDLATGEEVAPPADRYVVPFLSNGLTVVSHDDLWGIIDADGNYVVLPRYHHLRLVCENLALATTEPWPEWGEPISLILIDITDNREIATLTYVFKDGGIHDFRGDFAIFSIGEAWGAYWYVGLIDRAGREVLPPIYHNIRHFTDDLLIIDDDPAGRRRLQGRIVNAALEEILPWHDHIGWVSDGLATLNTGGEWIPFGEWGDEIINGLWGFIDETGHVVIPPVMAFDRVAPVSEGIAAVELDGKWGFIRVHFCS